MIQKTFSKESTQLALLEGEELLMELENVKCNTYRHSSVGLLFLTNCHIIFAHKTRSGYVRTRVDDEWRSLERVLIA